MTNPTHSYDNQRRQITNNSTRGHAMTPTLTTQQLTQNLVTTAKLMHPTYRAAIHLLTSDQYWMDRIEARAYVHGDDTPDGRCLRFNFSDASHAIRGGYLPSPMDHRDIMLLAASMAVGCVVSIDSVCSLPENMRANVVEAIAIMSGLTVTISNKLG